MGAGMTDEPIKAREFNAGMESLRAAMHDGFRAMGDTMAGIKGEVAVFRLFQMEQAEKNGGFSEKHRQHTEDISGARKSLENRVEEIKSKQNKTHSLALGALVSVLILLLGVIVDIALHYWKLR